MRINGETKREEQEISKVDGYIITGCLTLLGAFAVMLTIKAPLSKPVLFASVLSLSGLVASLFSSLWHKYRNPIRISHFERGGKNLVEEECDHIIDFIDLYVLQNPDAVKEFSKAFAGGLGKSGADKHYFGKYVQQTRDTIVAHLVELGTKTKELHTEAFDRPLSEPNATLKHIVDVLSRKLRYVGFVVGVLGFFIAVVTTMIESV